MKVVTVATVPVIAQLQIAIVKLALKGAAMALDPWSYAAKTRSENAEQTALFMWANMAARFGPNIANDPHSYTVAGFAMRQFEGVGALGFIRYTPPLPALGWLHAIHNQGHGDAIRGAQAKAQGVKAGVPDLFLPVPRGPGGFGASKQTPYHGFYIELKRCKSDGKAEGKPDAEQIRWQTYLQEAGYKAEIIFGWELASKALLAYLGFASY